MKFKEIEKNGETNREESAKKFVCACVWFSVERRNTTTKIEVRIEKEREVESGRGGGGDVGGGDGSSRGSIGSERTRPYKKWRMKEMLNDKIGERHSEALGKERF